MITTMETITLQNKEYFGYNPTTNNIEMMGELTGDYILSLYSWCYKSLNFQVVFCPDNNETFLISRPI